MGTSTGQAAGPAETAAQQEALGFCSLQQGWGRRPVVQELQVLHPYGGFCETGWNSRPHHRHICWTGGPGIWDIVFLAGSSGCQEPDKLITSDMGQSSFWRVQAGPLETLNRDGAAAT